MHCRGEFGLYFYDFLKGFNSLLFTMYLLLLLVMGEAIQRTWVKTDSRAKTWAHISALPLPSCGDLAKLNTLCLIYEKGIITESLHRDVVKMNFFLV